MNCTKCGIELGESICKECGANHKYLLYKMADEAQIRREYLEAIEYYELIKKSADSDEELRDINRVMAKLGFSLTDLTGTHLRNKKIKSNVLSSLKVIFIVSIVISTVLIIYNVYRLS